MLTKRLISRLALGVVLLAGGVALPTVALAHNDNHRDSRSRSYRGHDGDHHGKQERRWDRHDQRAVRSYERHPVVSPLQYIPIPAFPRPGNGVTVIFRHR